MSEFFTEDVILGAGLSDSLREGAPLVHQLGNPSSVTHATGSSQASSNAATAFPADRDAAGKKHTVRPDIKLRSASSKPKKPSRRAPPGPKKEVRDRECHNLVEKQYRTRLKAQFEALLAVLLAAQPLGHHDGGASGAGLGQYLSRGQVLDAAKKRILRLEKELERVASERDRLLRDLACFAPERGLSC